MDGLWRKLTVFFLVLFQLIVGQGNALVQFGLPGHQQRVSEEES